MRASEKPGTTMEDYLAWKLGLMVEQPAGAPVCLGIAHSKELRKPRRQVSWQQFHFLVENLRPARVELETLLAEFDDSDCTWDVYDDNIMTILFDEEMEEMCHDYLSYYTRN